jgi:hypothetical protein
MWMNEHEVEEAVDLFDSARSATPNLAAGASVLDALVAWTNDGRSDGWPYWRAPARAAKALMELLGAHTYAARFGYYQGTAKTLEDVSAADLNRALRPVKSFLTKQGVDWNAELPWAAILPAA